MGDFEVHINVDFGTHKSAAACDITKNGKRVLPHPLPLLLGGRSHDVRTVATWVDGELVHGVRLERLANGSAAVSDMVIDHFKLPLYTSAETSKISARVASILAEFGKSLDDLVADYLKAVVADARAAVLDTEYKAYFSRELIERMPYLVRITVPQIWTPQARRRMQAAAKAAGLSICVLAYEPQCAIAYLIDRAARMKTDRYRSIEKRLRAGSMILILDIGCGTGDFVLYRLQDDLSTSSRLEAIDCASGDLCGSFQVDELLLEALRTRKGQSWWNETRKKLGLKSERDLIRRGLAAVAKIKREFDAEMHPIATGSIWGIGAHYQHFELTKDEIHGAFDKVITKIIGQVDQLISKAGRKPEVIYASGGFSRSQYFMEKLRVKYEQQTRRTVVIRPNETEDIADVFPVAVGGLLRYDNISTSGLPSQYGYAYLQREYFDEKVHTDSYTASTSPRQIRTKNQNYQRDVRRVDKKWWVKTSPYDAEIDVVDDRLMNIIPRGSTIGPGETNWCEFTQEFRLPCADPRITAELVYLTRDFDDHDPARDYRRHHGQETDELRDGVHSWASVDIPIPHDQLRARGFAAGLSADGEPFWLLNARVLLESHGQDLRIGFEIVKPAPSARDPESSDAAEDRFAGESAFRVMETIWEQSHSEFIE